MKKTQVAGLFDWLIIPKEVIDELVGKVLVFQSEPEALAMLLVPLRDAFKRGNNTGAFWTLHAIMEAIYQHSLQHAEAEEEFQKNIEKMLAERINEHKKKEGGHDGGRRFVRKS